MEILPFPASLPGPQINIVSNGVVKMQIEDRQLGLGFLHFVITGATTLAQITNIALKIGDTKICNFGSASQVDKLNQFKNADAYATNSVFTLPVAQLGMNRFVDQWRTHLGMVSHDLIELEFTFTGATANDTLSLEVAEGMPGVPTKEIPMIDRRSINFASAGTYTIDYLLKNNKPELISGLYLFETGITIDSVEIKNRGVRQWKRTVAQNAQAYSRTGQRTAQSGLFAIDFGEDGYNRGGIWAGRNTNFEIILEVSSVTTGDIDFQKDTRKALVA